MSSIEELLAHIPPLAADTSNSSAPEVGTPGRNMLTHFPCWSGNSSEPKLIRALNNEIQTLLLQKRSVTAGDRSTLISPDISHFRTSGDTREDKICLSNHVSSVAQKSFRLITHIESIKPYPTSKIATDIESYKTIGPKPDYATGCDPPQPKALGSETELSEDSEISEIVYEDVVTEKPEAVLDPRDRRASISYNLKLRDLDHYEFSSKTCTVVNNPAISQWTYELFTPVNGLSSLQGQKKSETDFAHLSKTPVGSFEMRINIGMKGYYQ